MNYFNELTKTYIGQYMSRNEKTGEMIYLNIFKDKIVFIMNENKYFENIIIYKNNKYCEYIYYLFKNNIFLNFDEIFLLCFLKGVKYTLKKEKAIITLIKNNRNELIINNIY